MRAYFARLLGAAFLCAALFACSNGGVQPLPQSPAGTSSQRLIAIAALDRIAATIAQPTLKYHLYPVHKPTAGTATTQADVNYPSDLTYFGGATVKTALSHDIYVNCTASCWGSPQQFLDDLNNSTLIHVVDQYVGSTAIWRYGFGENAAAWPTITNNTISQSTLIAYVHRAAAMFGGGYTNIYHVFLPPGVDTCMPGTTQCYSPDNWSTFNFCAYHGSVDFGDKAGHVLFTVQPYQNTPGCQVTNGPNSALADSTDSTLSHEYFETISDPDPNTGWFNPTQHGEMADLCQNYKDVDLLYHRHYMVQEEYSNQQHGCTNGG